VLIEFQFTAFNDYSTIDVKGIKKFSIIAQVIIITSAEVIIAAASRFVDVPEEEINLMKGTAIPGNTKHATKFGMTLFRGKM